MICCECCPCSVPFAVASSSSSARNKAQEMRVTKGEFEFFHRLAEKFDTTVGRIVLKLNGKKNILEALKMAALSRIVRKEVSNPPTEAQVNDADNVRQLFCLLHIHENRVDISSLEQMVKASENRKAAKILAKYKKLLKKDVHKAVAHLVDVSTNGTCPRPDGSSCTLHLVFSDEQTGMLVEEVLACKDFFHDRFGVKPESIKYISAVIGNSLVVTWLASRYTGFRIMNQCRSVPVLTALREMEVLAVRLRYPGRLMTVKIDVSVVVASQLGIVQP